MRTSACLAEDEFWIRKALQLARRGEGRTRPNPPVGAIVVRNGRAVGSGYHRRAGGAHAEVLALRQAGPRARNAALYVTLEPCCTWGRTGPCTDVILASGIRRVVVSVTDPNPRHRGRGIRILREKGLVVTCGVCREAGERLLAPFAKWITTRTPYLTLKMGMTLDGRIADGVGRSRWITGPSSRRMVQQMRRRADAVLVGGGTARIDNPSLLGSGNSFLRRITVDSSLRLPLDAKMLNDGFASQTIVATTGRSPAQRRRRYEAKGATVWVLPVERGQVSLRSLLRRLGSEGFLHVLCEGGGELAARLIQQRLVDRFVFFVAGKILGPGAVPIVGGGGWPLATAPEVAFVGVGRCGSDLFLEAKPSVRGK